MPRLRQTGFGAYEEVAKGNKWGDGGATTPIDEYCADYIEKYINDIRLAGGLSGQLDGLSRTHGVI